MNGLSAYINSRTGAMNNAYEPESYWTEVAQRIKERADGKNVIAGDDEPYYRYKRKRFLQLLHSVDFAGKSVLEVGCGPGGNLLEVARKNPARLVGVDISAEMALLAKSKMHHQAEVYKVNGTRLDFPDQTFDIVFTATVLQHNTNETMLLDVMKEISRVSRKKVYLFERIESEIKGDELCLGRPVSYYEKIMKQNGFVLQSVRYINVRVSYYVCGAIRKLLNPRTRKEGEPLNRLSVMLQHLVLPLTRLLDRLFPSKTDVAKLEFERSVTLTAS
ncbi:MAG: class I SAM-dependent methyltransferase [Chitinophagales bacterium]|nr:class I SAM-dependent methyltransferase [Chitinophagales bacterium]MDW8392824.1 class I SAM-dependent methyltransferase [Chitinophagales bacterium]